MKSKFFKVVICTLLVLSTVSTNVFADETSNLDKVDSWIGGIQEKIKDGFDTVIDTLEGYRDTVDEKIDTVRDGITIAKILAAIKLGSDGVPFNDDLSIDFEKLFSNLGSGIKNIINVNMDETYIDYDVNIPTKFGSKSISLANVYASYDDGDRYIEITLDEDFLAQYSPTIKILKYDEDANEWVGYYKNLTFKNTSLVVDLEDDTKLIKLYTVYQGSSGTTYSVERIYNIAD